MDSMIFNGARRMRLTKEELLAGYCMPNPDKDNEQDPRFKSPDELLSKREPAPSPKKIILQQTSQPRDVEKELWELQQRYSSDIGEWKKYEREIVAWKAKVIAVVNQMKMEAEQKHKLELELQQARAEIKRKDEMLRFMKNQLA